MPTSQLHKRRMPIHCFSSSGSTIARHTSAGAARIATDRSIDLACGAATLTSSPTR